MKLEVEEEAIDEDDLFRPENMVQVLQKVWCFYVYKTKPF